MSERWDEPSWSVSCGPNLIQLIAKGYGQIVSDVSVDLSEETHKSITENKMKRVKGNLKNKMDFLYFCLSFFLVVWMYFPSSLHLHLCSLDVVCM